MTTAKQGGQHPHARQTTQQHSNGEEAVRARRRRLGSLLATFGVLLATACGAADGSSREQGTGDSGSGGSAATSDGSGGGSSTSVALTAGGVASTDYIGGALPDTGQYFLTIQVTLSDLSAPVAVPVGVAYYSLATVQGLVITPSAASDLVAMPCASDTSVSAGAQHTCTIVFGVPTGDAPARLSYDDGRGDRATTPISGAAPVPQDSACAATATYQNLSSDACAACASTQCGPEQSTLVAQQADGITCPGADTACAACPFVSSADYCGCEEACLGGCRPAFDALFECYVAQCAGACM